MKSVVYGCVTLTVILVAWYHLVPGPPPPVESTDARVRIENLYLGTHGLKPVMKPVKVEAFRVESVTSDREDLPKVFGGQTVLAGPVEIDEQTTRFLVEHLTNPQNYLWGMESFEFVEPSVVIRFSGKSNVTEVGINFGANQLEVRMVGRGLSQRSRFSTSRLRRPLIRTIKQLFPEDETILILR